MPNSVFRTAQDPLLDLHSDPGLQPERTTLAWMRTMLALLVSSSLFLRWIDYHGLLATMPFLLCLVVSLVIQLSNMTRQRRAVRGINEERIDADPRSVWLLAGVTVGIALLGLIVVLM